MPHRRLAAAGILLAIIVGIVALLPGARNIVHTFQAVDTATLDDRTVIWQYSLDHFASYGGFKLLFGEGLSSGIPALSSMFPETPNYHNVYLMWLMERGIVGLFLFALFLYRIGRAIIKTTHNHKHPMLGWYIYLLVSGLSATVSHEHIFWILLGVVVGAASHDEAPCTASRSEPSFRGPLPTRTTKVGLIRTFTCHGEMTRGDRRVNRAHWCEQTAQPT
jgi:O-antigen ligase